MMVGLVGETTVELELSEPDVLYVKASFGAGLAQLSPELADAGRRLLDTLATPNWCLEWRLPRWLGDALGLDDASTRSLVLANVYGLAYVRLHDDLADAEIDHQAPAAINLASVFFEQWMAEYRRLFTAGSPFWSFLDGWLTRWAQATHEAGEPLAADLRAYGEEDFLRLAERAAPLKICCAGACLCSGRAALIPTLTTGLDHFLVAAVLLDHVCDWADDLAAGRYNAFVAYASALPQTPAQAGTNRRRVLETIYLHAGVQPYYAMIVRYLRSARRTLRALDSPDLSRYLQQMERLARDHGQQIAGAARRQLRQASGQLWRLPMAGHPPAVRMERG